MVGHPRIGVQPEAMTGVVDANASRPFIRLQAEGVEVTSVGRVPYQKRTDLRKHKYKSK